MRSLDEAGHRQVVLCRAGDNGLTPQQAGPGIGFDELGKARFRSPEGIGFMLKPGDRDTGHSRVLSL